MEKEAQEARRRQQEADVQAQAREQQERESQERQVLREEAAKKEEHEAKKEEASAAGIAGAELLKEAVGKGGEGETSREVRGGCDGRRTERLGHVFGVYISRKSTNERKQS